MSETFSTTFSKLCETCVPVVSIWQSIVLDCDQTILSEPPKMGDRTICVLREPPKVGRKNFALSNIDPVIIPIRISKKV